MTASLEEMVRHRQKLWWLAGLNALGAIVSVVWLLYLVFEAAGFWRMILAESLLGFFIWPGPALLFAVGASLLCFHYSVVGLWLPVLSYCSAGIALIFDFRLVRRLHKPDEPGTLDAETEYAQWTYQLAGIVADLGTDSPEIEIRVYPEHTYNPHEAAPLFTARPNDFHATLTHLRDNFGSGVFWVIVFVRGEIRRRFALFVPVDSPLNPGPVAVTGRSVAEPVGKP